MKLNPKIIFQISRAMNYTYINYLPDYRSNVSTISKNGLHANVWARRAEMIHNSFKDSEDIKVIHIDRKIWDCEAILDTLNNKLYLMITEKNLRLCQKKYSDNGFSTHYLFSLLYYNAKLLATGEQLSLLPNLTEDQQQHRIDDSNAMLSDWADKVKEVIVCAFSEINGSVTQATAYLFDEGYNEVESTDISSVLLDSTDATPTLNTSRKSDTSIERPQIKIKLRTKTRSQEEAEKRENKQSNL